MKQLVLIIVLIATSFACFAKSGKEIIAENSYKPSVTPLLTTQWAQEGCENAKLPILYEGSEQRAVTGCGATAMAQLMNYWQYPKQGLGDNYFVWESPSGKRQVLYADFQNTTYQWEHMASVYQNNSMVTQEEIDAVSTLMLHIGIALEMKFNTNTATQIEYIHTVLKKYFGYNPNSLLLRYVNGAYTMDEWLAIIYKELSEGRPVLMGGATASGANHIFVADGYDENGKVHLNLGHANRKNEDQYYDLTRTDQTYTNDMRMIIGVCPETTEAELTVVNVSAPGSLLEALGGEINSTKVCRLKVIGLINKSDVATLSSLSKMTTGQLSYIDLSDCVIEGNELPTDAFNADNQALQEIILPDNLKKIGNKAFRNCTGLYKVHFPQELEEIGNFAFSYCRYLGEVSLPKSFARIGTNPFRYDKVDKFDIEENTLFTVSNNALVSKDGKTLYAMPVKCLDNFVVPDGVERINQQAFLKSCMMSSLTLPTSLTQIEDNAFLECYNLKNVYCQAYVAPVLKGSPFDVAISSCTLHVPKGCIEGYEQKGWTMFAQIVDDLQSSTSVISPQVVFK